MTLLIRMMWKDWGFADALFRQGKYFLGMAGQAPDAFAREGYIRASIVFFLMAFEAYLGDAVRGYIGQHEVTIPPTTLQRVREEMEKRSGRVGDAARDWPRLLTGIPFDTSTKAYQDFRNFLQYRNALVHGSITARIPSWGRLAQEVETVEQADLARETVVEMMKGIAKHLRLEAPGWI